MQHNRDEATLPLNCLFQWPRIHRAVCKWVNSISKETKQLLSFSSTIRKILMLLEIRNKIVMINKGAERAELPQDVLLVLARMVTCEWMLTELFLPQETGWSLCHRKSGFEIFHDARDV